MEIKDLKVCGVDLSAEPRDTFRNQDISLGQELRFYMIQKRYSEKTIKSYVVAVMRFSRWLSKPITEVNGFDIEQYNRTEIVDKQYSLSMQNQVVSALKLLFTKVLLIDIKIESIERPISEKKLPIVLSPAEIRQLLASTYNHKHRVMLSLIYAAGLRRSELLNLRPSDIDGDSGQLFIRAGKGKKDRCIFLSEKSLQMLRTYYKAYRPKTWLFEGEKPGSQYTESSIQNVFRTSMKRSGIRKPATLHSLRHSFATHLMNSGTDTRIIQELLGHSSIKTTEIYTHVSTKELKKIKSPFDDL